MAQEQPFKVIIIGAGIAGLSLHHFLLTALPSASITTYESYPRTVIAIGGGLGLAPNGVHVLRLLSQSAHDHIVCPERSFAAPYFELHNSKGRVLGLMGTDKLPPYRMTKRHVVYDAVRIALEEKGGHVVYEKKVKGVKEVEGGVEVSFGDGGVEVCDLVVGADGFKSVVRKAAFEGKVEPIYQQLAGVGGFIPAAAIPVAEREKLKQPNTSGVVMTFGPDGFFGYSPCDELGDEGEYMWWSTAEMPVSPDKSTKMNEETRSELMERHKGWLSPEGASVIEEILRVGTGEGWDNKQFIPNYQMTKVERYGSSSGRIALIGDAAHIVPPHSGQGASQALEDSYAFSAILAHFRQKHDKVDESLKKTMDEFTKLRKPRIDKIMGTSEQAAKTKKKLSWWQELLRDCFFWLVCKLMPVIFFRETYGYKIDEEVDKHVLKIKDK